MIAKILGHYPDDLEVSDNFPATQEEADQFERDWREQVLSDAAEGNGGETAFSLSPEEEAALAALNSLFPQDENIPF